MRIEKTEIFNSKCNASATAVNVAVHLGEDIAAILPYLNATQEKARFYPAVPYVRFLWKGHIVNVEARVIRAFGYESDIAAKDEADRIVLKIEQVLANRDAIEPDETPYSPPSVLELLRHLPKIATCGKCGFPTCMAFASAVARGECTPEACLPLGEADRASDLAALEDLLG